ncbi:caspase family protein [Sorangium sp. So ce260]|uniref:caspase family protein n=1 Tax=Sorangium sp. So ce260 TaxID=3133291 RepID=UPI003F612E18
MTLFEDRRTGGPATHVLIVGCGAYPHLAASPSPPFGLRPLSSPAKSAAAIAEFFATKYKNDRAPLGTIEVLASPASDPRIGPCDLASIAAAAGRWFNFCDSDEENVAVFYFCGHGFERGTELALLADDFGRTPPPLNPMNEAINLDALVEGMARCRARGQCFFIDCCRDLPESQAQTLGSFGVAILQPFAKPLNAGRDYSIYYATGATSRAFGRVNAPSRFTEALLRAMRGAGADEENGAWRVDTSALHRGLRAIFELENGRPGVPKQVPRLGGNTYGFVLHELAAPPEVPVVIGCDPTTRNVDAKFLVSDPAGKQWSRDALPEDWEIELSVAEYSLEIAISQQVVSSSLPVWPPSRTRRVRVP